MTPPLTSSSGIEGVPERRVIERAVALDLLHAVYRAEGWVRAEGESMTKRVKSLYVITADARRNRYIATPKAPSL